jgi:hypothetical protein
MTNRFATTAVLIINLVLAYVAGLITIAGYFTRGGLADLQGTLAHWVAVLVGFALLVGFANLVKVHIGRALGRQEGWPYSLIVVASALTVLGLGLVGGSPGTETVSWVFRWIYQPLGAAVFSLLAFFLTTAFFRAMRLGSREAVVMLVIAFLVVLGQAPFAASAPLDILARIEEWIQAYPALAGMRAILLGVSLGAVGVSVRVLLGLDRPYME